MVGSVNQNSNVFNVFSKTCMLQIKKYLCYLANLSPLFLIQFFQYGNPIPQLGPSLSLFLSVLRGVSVAGHLYKMKKKNTESRNN